MGNEKDRTDILECDGPLAMGVRWMFLTRIIPQVKRWKAQA